MFFLFGVRRGGSQSQQNSEYGVRWQIVLGVICRAVLLVSRASCCHWQVMGVEKVVADEVLGGGDWLDGNGKALRV